MAAGMAPDAQPAGARQHDERGHEQRDDDEHRCHACEYEPTAPVTDQPTIELLYFVGCPSHEQLLPAIERLAAQSGATLRLRRVETPEAAERERFLGSPTVRVNGVDVDPGAPERTDLGLKCRIYRFDAGQSPLPPEWWIRAALEHGVEE